MHLSSKFVACALIGFLLTACSKSTKTTSPPAESPRVMASATATEAASPSATSAEATAAMAPTPTAPAASGSPTITVAFTDIKGVFAEQAIRDEASLGVFGTTSGNFEPNKPISRGEYVKWLVTAYNIYYKDDPRSQLRMPETVEMTFVDVPSTSPYWKYVQALTDAGFAVGVDAKHFAPDRLINRQEMVAIKTQVDHGSKIVANPNDKATDQFVDRDSIDKLYRTIVNADMFDGSTHNFSRVWGKTNYFHPQKPVTRGEAAVSLSEIAGRTAARVVRR